MITLWFKIKTFWYARILRKSNTDFIYERDDE